MAGIEIQNYRGDFEDIVELTYRVWMPEYGGKTWIPLPQAAFLREKLSPESDVVAEADAAFAAGEAAVEDQPEWIWFERGSLGRTKIKSPERGNGRRDKRHLIFTMPRAEGKS